MLDLSPLGLGEPPFSLSPDPRYFYVSLQHKATLAKATYAIEQRQGLSVIFGDVGVGSFVWNAPGPSADHAVVENGGERGRPATRTGDGTAADSRFGG